MKFFNRNPTQNVDPRSKPFVDKIKELLIANGISDPHAITWCSFNLFRHSLSFFRRKGTPTDEDIKAFGDKLLAVLVKYDITDSEQQDKLLCGYFEILDGMSDNERK